MCTLLRKLSRGADANDRQPVFDRDGLSVLGMQIRELRVSLARSRQALAIAVETGGLLERQSRVNDVHLVELADRAFLASQAGKRLAFHEAEALAAGEKNRARLRAERSALEDEMVRIRAAIGEAVRRQIALDEGSRAADLAASWRRMSDAPHAVDRSLFDATSATLDDLCRLQVEADDAMTALASAEPHPAPAERAAQSGWVSSCRARSASERRNIGAAA